MKASEMDWSVMRGCVILLVVCVLLAGTAVVVSYHFKSKQEGELQRARALLIAARSQYQTLDEEEDIIATYLPRYSALEERGIIGREQRLDWIETLRESARIVEVPKLQYVIDAQQPFETGVRLEVGDYGVYTSTMRLDLGLLHEGDLLRLLARLRERVSGLLNVGGCALTRAQPELQMAAGATNVQAQCLLNFITIRHREGGVEAPS